MGAFRVHSTFRTCYFPISFLSFIFSQFSLFTFLPFPLKLISLSMYIFFIFVKRIDPTISSSGWPMFLPSSRHLQLAATPSVVSIQASLDRGLQSTCSVPQTHTVISLPVLTCISSSLPAVYLQNAGVQIPLRTVSDHWPCKLLWAGGVRSAWVSSYSVFSWQRDLGPRPPVP